MNKLKIKDLMINERNRGKGVAKAEWIDGNLCIYH